MRVRFPPPSPMQWGRLLMKKKPGVKPDNAGQGPPLPRLQGGVAESGRLRLTSNQEGCSQHPRGFESRRPLTDLLYQMKGLEETFSPPSKSPIFWRCAVSSKTASLEQALEASPHDYSLFLLCWGFSELHRFGQRRAGHTVALHWRRCICFPP